MILTYVLPGQGRVPQLAVPIRIQVRLNLRLLAPRLLRPLRQPRGASIAHGTIFIYGCVRSAWMSNLEKRKGSLRLAVEIGLTYARNKDLLWYSVKDGIKEACEALFDSYREYADHFPSLLVGPLADLAGRPEGIFEFADRLRSMSQLVVVYWSTERSRVPWND